MKAYSSCVGEGPFTCELFGDEAKALRDAEASTVLRQEDRDVSAGSMCLPPDTEL